MSFLPTGYKDPSGGSNYMTFAQGANKIRLISDAVMGWEYWTEIDGKRRPIRVQSLKDVPVEFRNPVDPKNNPKFFWAMAVWNYAEEKAQLLQIKQSTIRGMIESFYNNPDWGDPKEYDITITKKGEDLATEYSAVPSPKKPFDTTEKYIPVANLQAWMEGGDPFSSEVVGEPEEKVSDEELKEIAINFDDLDSAK
jgi:hypothetical protein